MNKIDNKFISNISKNLDNMNLEELR